MEVNIFFYSSVLGGRGERRTGWG